MSSPHVCDLLVVRVFPLRCTLGCTRAADEARHEPATRTDTVRNESLTHHMVDELGHLRSATVRRCGLRRDEDEDDVQVFPEADKGHLRAKFLWIGVELSCFLCPFRIFGSSLLMSMPSQSCMLSLSQKRCTVKTPLARSPA